MAIPQVYHHLLFLKRRDLWILDELSKNPVSSQRELSQRCKIALGMTNARIRTMTKKGWLEVRPFDCRRTGYYLTSRGVSAKDNLTLDLISCSLQYYTELKKIISQQLSRILGDGKQRIVFYGLSDEMEVAYLALQEMNLTLIGIVDDDETFEPGTVLGYRLEPVSRVNELKPDCILITTLGTRDLKRERLRTLVDPNRVCIADIWVRGEMLRMEEDLK